MECEEEELALMGGLAEIEIGRRHKRPLCPVCNRPEGVCWCSSLNEANVVVKSKVLILQHPHEEKRCLRTAPILEKALNHGHYIEAKGKRFSSTKFPALHDIFTSENTLIMYPGKQAIDIETLPPVSESQPPYNIVIIDGTWQQAKAMYFNSKQLHSLRQVCASGKYVSEYTIRTQPAEDALSTVESAAICLSVLERDWNIYYSLVRPLQTLCKFQMDHGAVTHHSKEQMILSGRYNKPMGKRTYRKLRKCGVRNTNLTYNDIIKLSCKAVNPQHSTEYGEDLSSSSESSIISNPSMNNQATELSNGNIEFLNDFIINQIDLKHS